ncbi:hypothetical protein [Kribbella sp. NBC_00889]|uniref:hypothetical protein n=1 Tax=Kribbella sp. NBC_00889 TaxID=2975974 RepID=UPI00386872E3|nr:hypothetical protein OG817_25120 [Kribbella sp. NBC_00889]
MTMWPTTIVNLKDHRDDPAYADVVYMGRAMHRGGWHLDICWLGLPGCAGAGWVAGVRRLPAMRTYSRSG